MLIFLQALLIQKTNRKGKKTSFNVVFFKEGLMYPTNQVGSEEFETIGNRHSRI